MNSFVFNDAIRFKLATQQEDIGAKTQMFLGVFVGVILRWIVVDVRFPRRPALFHHLQVVGAALAQP